jgi:nucleotide-binding universal stress UspA family protein
MPLDHLVPELHETLMRDLQTWAGEVAGEGETTFRVIPGAGRADVHLTQLADEAEADLLVVGTHQRAGVSHLWQGSVSRGVLHHAHCNVACVPRRDSAEDERGIPTFRRVLIPTDFSSLANRAIARGYGLLSSGGVAHLLHVVTGKSGEDERDSKRRLHALIPLGAAARGIVTEIEVMNDQDAGMGI